MSQEQASARYRFLMALLIDRGVLTNSRYPNGVWSLQGIYGIDDSGLRGAGRTAEEAIDNAIAAAKLDPADKLTHWRETHETLKRNADAEEGTLGFAALAAPAQAAAVPEAVDLTAQRKKFMNWACDEFKTVHVKGDGFKEHDVRAAWLGWKAALAGGGV